MRRREHDERPHGQVPQVPLVGWRAHRWRARQAQPPAGSLDVAVAKHPRNAAHRLRPSQDALELAAAAGPFEWADIAWDLCDAGKPGRAAEFWMAVIELYDCDARVWLYLSDALGEASRFEEALEAAGRGLELEPDNFEFQEAVLDLLFALGRNEHQFSWTVWPQITRLGAPTRDLVASWLVAEAECDVFDLRYTLFEGHYLCFDVEDLARDLEEDARFEVCRFEGAAFVSLSDRPVAPSHR